MKDIQVVERKRALAEGVVSALYVTNIKREHEDDLISLIFYLSPNHSADEREAAQANLIKQWIDKQESGEKEFVLIAREN